MTDAEIQLPIQLQQEPQIADRACTPADPLIVFGYACLRREFQALLSHRPQPDSTPSADDIHRMRIAARRLRVGLRLFTDLLPGETAVTLSDELRWFARALGEVRDLDVYTQNLHVYAKGIDADAAADVERFEGHLQHERAARRATLATLFAGQRYETLLTSFSEFVADAPSPGALRRWQSLRIADAAQEHLRASLKRVRKHGDRITIDTQDERLHQLRIRAKRLRYALEFFAETYPALDRLASAAKRLQDVLGEHQDACTANNRLSEYLSTQDGVDSRALARLLQGQQQQAAHARRLFGAEWRRFKKNVSQTQLRAEIAA